MKCIGCVRSGLTEMPLQTRGLEIAGSARCVCQSGWQQGREGTPGLKLDRSCSLLCFYKRRQQSSAGREINEGKGGRERQTKGGDGSCFAANGPLWMCVCVCGRMGARVLAPQNDGGLGPGLMRCFRDNARRRVDMWFGRGLYAIFYSLFLITYFSVFFTLPFLSPALHPHHLSAAFSYPQSGGWQWQIEEHRSSTSTRLEGQIITGYFPPPFLFFFFPRSLGYSCETAK